MLKKRSKEKPFTSAQRAIPLLTGSCIRRCGRTEMPMPFETALIRAAVLTLSHRIWTLVWCSDMHFSKSSLVPLPRSRRRKRCERNSFSVMGTGFEPDTEGAPVSDEDETSAQDTAGGMMTDRESFM